MQKTPWSTAGTIIRDVSHETFQVSWILIKIVIPVALVVRLLECAGLLPDLAALLRPLMTLVGLPPSMALVWAITLLTNLYGGLAAFMALQGQESLTIAQVTTLSSMMLIAHALPVELGIAHKAGVRWWLMGAIRVGGALVYGLILHGLTTWIQCWQDPIKIQLLTFPTDHSWSAWVCNQGRNILLMVVIVFMLMGIMKLLRWLKVTHLLERMLCPLLRLLGMTPKATEMTVIGMTLGISYGGGLIIRRLQQGDVPSRDVFNSMVLMGLCHSVIEDTLLMLTLGTHVLGILVGRVVFALCCTLVISRILKKCSLPLFSFKKGIAKSHTVR